MASKATAPVSTGLKVNPELLGDDPDTGLPEGVYASEEEIPADRVKLFETNKQVYAIKRRVEPKMVFRYMRRVRQDGDAAAAADLMYDVLGEPVMDVLCDEDLDDAQMAAVIRAVQKHTMGGVEAVLGNSTNGSRRSRG